MELYNPLLVVVDPGHGGRDSGGAWAGRMEKDDNLRLATTLREVLIRHGVEPLMTRDTDLYIPLQDRVNLANANGADLFVSLHRGFSPDAVVAEFGVQNSIFLTAPDATTSRAAAQVLSAVVEVGVQANRGVSRSNSFVLRRTHMPAMSLEMGFLGNTEDNRLFDQHLHAYAEAIARGILEYFGIAYQPPANAVEPAPLPQPIPLPNPASPPCPAPSPSPLPSPAPHALSQPAPRGVPQPGTASAPPVIVAEPPSVEPEKPKPSHSAPAGLVKEAQQALGRLFGQRLEADGVIGFGTKRAAVRVMQTLINETRGGSLAVDGILGAATRSLLPVLRQGDRGHAVSLLQILLRLHGYDAGRIDGIFGPLTRTAVTSFQKNHFLVPDGVAGPRTLAHLLH